MRYTYRYQLEPTDTHREQLDFYRDTCRQLYNHALKEFNDILSRGFEQLGVVHSEETPVETALPMFTSSDSSDAVDLKRVIESGSPTLKK
jgi:Helix-turn-helix domain.